MSLLNWCCMQVQRRQGTRRWNKNSRDITNSAPAKLDICISPGSKWLHTMPVLEGTSGALEISTIWSMLLGWMLLAASKLSRRGSANLQPVAGNRYAEQGGTDSCSQKTPGDFCMTNAFHASPSLADAFHVVVGSSGTGANGRERPRTKACLGRLGGRQARAPAFRSCTLERYAEASSR